MSRFLFLSPLPIPHGLESIFKSVRGRSDQRGRVDVGLVLQLVQSVLGILLSPLSGCSQAQGQGGCQKPQGPACGVDALASQAQVKQACNSNQQSAAHDEKAGGPGPAYGKKRPWDSCAEYSYLDQCGCGSQAGVLSKSTLALKVMGDRCPQRNPYR